MEEKEIKNEELKDIDMVDDISALFRELYMTDELLELQKEIRRKYPEFDPDHVMTPEEDERFWREIREVID